MKSLGAQPPPQPPPPMPPPPQAVPPPLTQAVPLFTEDLPPAEKKQKVEEEEDDKVSWTSFGSDLETEWKDDESENCDDYSSEDEYCPNYPQQKKRDQALWDKYYQQIEESDGFDIEDFPGRCMMATIYPLPRYLNNPKNYDMLKGYAERALEVYNAEKGTDYSVVEVLKVNGGGCKYYDFYITFTVKTLAGKGDFFQAKVVEDLRGNLEFPIIRPKPKKDLDV